MIKLKEAVIVEGKYDKIRLSSVVDALIIETEGFRIFKDAGKRALIKRLAEEKGILVLTDSDSAGFMIRAELSSFIPPERIRHAYIPDIEGKERRKAAFSKEGKLGVEGMDSALLERIILSSGVSLEEKSGQEVSKADLYLMGLSGTEGSAGRRAALLEELGLPERLPVNSMLKVINTLYGKEEFAALCDRLFGKLTVRGEGFEER